MQMVCWEHQRFYSVLHYYLQFRIVFDCPLLCIAIGLSQIIIHNNVDLCLQNVKGKASIVANVEASIVGNVEASIVSGVGEGGAGGATVPPLLKVGGTAPPTLGHDCTLKFNEEKISSHSVSATV